MVKGMEQPLWQVRWVDSVEEIAAELWELCFPPPLEGVWWYRALERSGLQEQFRFLYALVFHDGEAVAIAPAFVMDVPLDIIAPPWCLPLLRLLSRLAPSLPYQRTLFIGSPCSEQGSVGSLPGVERLPLLESIQRTLPEQAKRLQAPMIVWKDFAESDGALLRTLAANHGLFAMTSYPGTVCALPEDKESYLRTLSGSRRHQLKKKWRRSASAVAVEMSVLQQPDAESLQEIHALFEQTYQRAETKFERLNSAFFQWIALSPPAHFLLLREKESKDLLAFMLCFRFPGYVVNKFVGFDYQRPREWLLYFRLWEAAVDWALANGARFIQSGQTVYGAKIAVGHLLVPLTNYGRHRNPVVHWIYGKIAPGISWQSLDDDLANYLQSHSLASLSTVSEEDKDKKC
ncbi:GNAT family N-acetyltransferase [Candidatus Magnetaquicoccus inordinatus]|uniref:GNAT family N-acetyltransferase n=1 Tax=Candidatus Magnetaquicoccus inordinatus TaxID=2496818 RepID=UPI00102CA0F1|nr:GNAT family N-acetyltransferase [Candidatus Magnetaquicoccus inordinatus]